MRVLHAVESLFKFGGANIACVDFANYQAISGNSIALFSTNISADLKLYISEEVEKVVLCNKAVGILGVKNIKLEFDRLIKEFKPDIVHAHGVWDPLIHVVINSSKNENIPIIHSPHGMLTNWALNHKRIKKCIAWNLYQKKDLNKVSAFHVTAIAEKLDIQRLGFDKQAEVIPLGINLPKLDIRNVKQKKRILFLSRINPKKGILYLIEAWDKIRNPEWEIIICGPDEDNYLAKVQDRIISLGLSEFFILKSAVQGKEKDDLFRDCDLFVLPTLSENFGIVILEALSYGLPVITTVGSPWELIKQYNAGKWIEIGVDPLIKALSELMALKDSEYIEMSSNARLLAKENFSWNNIIKELLNFYQKTVNTI